ncbi:MAG TPA: PilN domain-containing protein [Solirubrobacterales bacterium]|nr:PilN domain-containing protein [Solirubrobacterales bacterium]
MRPVNLIPLEERRGEQAPLRSGPLAYILLGALVAILAGVTALVLVGNQIEEREAQITELTREDEAAAAKAARLSAFVEFRNLAEQRVETVSSLADSRFDWERVMRELALILPGDAWLTSLTASASAEAGVSGGASGLRGAVPGPALELSGCAAGQESVAGFLNALKDIEGVTRVAVASSELPDAASNEGGGGGGGSGGSDDECRTRDFIARFEIVVAFDAAPVPVAAAAGAEPTAVTDEPSESEEASEDDDAAESEGE